MSYLQQPSPRDYALPPDFVETCKDSNVDVAVVGNGGSISDLSDIEIKNINKSRLFRCNWAFKDPSKIKKEYAIYFSQAYGAAIHGVGSDTHLVQQIDECIETGTVSVFRYWIDILYNENPLCTFLSPDGVPVWPTTGIQMLLFAAYQVTCPAVHVAGIDMYTHKRPDKAMNKQQTLEYLKKYGKPFSDSRDNSSGITLQRVNLTYGTPSQWSEQLKKFHMTYHFIHIDILVLMLCFYRFYSTSTPVYIYQNSAVSKIKQITHDNISMVHDYFTSTGSLNNQINKKNCYRMWRLINKTASDLFSV